MKNKVRKVDGIKNKRYNFDIITRLKEALYLLIGFIKWLIFGNVAIYAATRVINFFHDPYMEELSGMTGSYSTELLPMFTQTLTFMIIFGLVVSTYRVLFKKNYTWQNIFVLAVTLVIVLIGISL